MSAVLNPLVVLSAWVFGAVLGQAACDSDYLELVATNLGDIEGCYRKSSHLTSAGRAVFTSTDSSGLRGTTTYAILGSWVSNVARVWGVELLGVYSIGAEDVLF